MRLTTPLAALATAFILTACHDITGAAATTAASAAAPESLNDDQKYALAFMWHEEKLAHDLYLALNDVNPAMQLSNIANKSEITHVAMVEALVKTYDINITNLEDYTVAYSEDELRALAPGTFAIPEIQKRYDTLYVQGVESLAASLETGCKVEVIDVEDLNGAIATAAGHQDIIDTFELLRSQSYNHYWAFDGALKNLGVVDGCCSLGERFCKSAEAFPRTMH